MDESVSTYYHSPVGLLKISGNETFIHEVTFYDKTEVHEPRHRHLPAVMVHCVEQLIQYFNGALRQFDLPIKQEGTVFQQDVWNQLMTIPYGKTISYLQLARQLGDAKAIRAAASANGKNQIAIIVPCHRVIGSNRSLVGYAGGLWRKKWLLEHEAKYTYGIQTLF